MGDDPDRRGMLARLPVPDGLCGHAEFSSDVALPDAEVEAPALVATADVLDELTQLKDERKAELQAAKTEGR